MNDKLKHLNDKRKRRYVMVKRPRRSVAASRAAALKGWRTRKRLAAARTAAAQSALPGIGG